MPRFLEVVVASAISELEKLAVAGAAAGAAAPMLRRLFQAGQRQIGTLPSKGLGLERNRLPGTLGGMARKAVSAQPGARGGVYHLTPPLRPPRQPIPTPNSAVAAPVAAPAATSGAARAPIPGDMQPMFGRSPPQAPTPTTALGRASEWYARLSPSQRNALLAGATAGGLGLAAGSFLSPNGS